MFKRIIETIKSGGALVFGFVFALVAAPVIHLSGLDNVDSCPTPEDIEKSQKQAAVRSVPRVPKGNGTKQNKRRIV